MGSRKENMFFPWIILFFHLAHIYGKESHSDIHWYTKTVSDVGFLSAGRNKI